MNILYAGSLTGPREPYCRFGRDMRHFAECVLHHLFTLAVPRIVRLCVHAEMLTSCVRMSHVEDEVLLKFKGRIRPPLSIIHGK
jgi:hypothetical protein